MNKIFRYPKIFETFLLPQNMKKAIIYPRNIRSRNIEPIPRM